MKMAKNRCEMQKIVEEMLKHRVKQCRKMVPKTNGNKTIFENIAQNRFQCRQNGGKSFAKSLIKGAKQKS